MENLTSNDLLGKAFFPIIYKNKSEFFSQYFSLLNNIGKQLKDFESSSLITGFYINHIYNPPDNIENSIRAGYFTTEKNKLISEAKFKKISNNNIHNEPPKEFTTSAALFGSSYPDIEILRAKQFLNTYSHVGLDLLEKLGAKSVYDLISLYKLKIVLDPQQKLYDDTSISKEDIKLTFAEVFNKNSNFLNNLNSNFYSKDDLWEDLVRYRISFVDSTNYHCDYFGHFLVNMFLIPDEKVLIPLKTGSNIVQSLFNK